jgi:polyhydroxybutyrate depolymerase
MLRGVVIAAAGWLAACGPSLAAGPISMMVDGQQRSYLITQPATPAGPKPTIIMLHGLDDTAQATAQGSGLAALAPQAGFVAVFPSGLAEQWNLFPDGQVPAAFAQQAQHAGVPVGQDVDFIKALVTSLVSSNIADPHRIYLAGFSAGGFMTMRMLCTNPQLFAGIALISSSMAVPTATDCHASATPALFIKGTADDHESFYGGPVLDKQFIVWSAVQLTAFMTQVNGCDPLATTTGTYPNTKTKVKIDTQTWDKCTAPVTLYTVEGGVHTIFPVPPAAQTMWDFFKGHSR